MTVASSDYANYLHGGLLNGQYLRVKGLNEGSFGIVSIAKDTKEGDKLVAIKYNTGRLGDFEAYQNKTKSEDHIVKVRSMSLNSNTRSVIKSDATFSHTETSDKDVSKSIVLRETKQEVAMIKKVDTHPNITTLLDHFDTYMVFEYAPRGDLHDAIQLGIAPVATSDVIDVFMQLISAVEFCHKNGVYHRDIKPENILIADDWSIKLTDFGLATDHLICNDFDVGSERYMAPELLEHSDIDSYAADKVDIWSLGICLLNIVFGKSPFRSASSKDKMFLHYAANRETLFDIFPFMSYDLFSVMIHSLTIDPANRDLEMIKVNLLNIDVLTYDYEFEEDVDDIKAKALVEEIGEDESYETDGKQSNAKTEITSKAKIEDNIDEVKPTIEGESLVVSLDKSSEDNDKKENVMRTDAISAEAIPQISIDSAKNEIDESKPKFSPKIGPSLQPPTALASANDKMGLIDTLLGTDTNNNYTVSKPINIQKKYEPPHKLLANSLNDNKKININYENRKANNNHNYRARRWNPAHRKPLKIANYNYRNKSQDGRIGGRDPFKDDSFDFNRKDFFTPRSVFTHYMEKANRGKQNIQQRGSYYRKNKEFENSSNNYTYNYRHAFNNTNNYYDYCDRRAWQKRKRRSSNAPSSNSNKNKNSYRSGNMRSRNNKWEAPLWNSGNDHKVKNSRRLSAGISTVTNSHPIRVSSSLRSSMDGKYIPPNLRFNASHLLGSAVVSDDDTETDNDNMSGSSKHTNKGQFESPRGIRDIAEDDDDTGADQVQRVDDSDEETFSFEFDQPTLAGSNGINILEGVSPSDDREKFKQIQSNAMNLLSKQFTESRLFDEKNTSRDTSLTTTISNNFSSTGSNINNSPKGYKKYIPPHHRRSSHSAADTGNLTSNLTGKPVSNAILSHFVGRSSNKNMSPVSTSAPTKSSSFFGSCRNVPPHELLTEKGYSTFVNSDQLDDNLFNIEEGNYITPINMMGNGFSEKKPMASSNNNSKK
ncbi:hypothetical protein PMKS-000017 [Pichia membranifaciens]|uniref:Protein kinase domain-containing protein n=1 Tax=Pichia membranifaciens TaxID=4926 RepID=A0A1Q2YAU7_9ASCO|nr:hypothetical protein PMKS-000017 [Pichia membranifaciens]